VDLAATPYDALSEEHRVISIDDPNGGLGIFTGGAHPEFAREICDILDVELLPSTTRRFSNDCLQTQLEANCRQRDIYIVQPLVTPVQDNLMELLLMLDAARGASAAQLTAVIPHYAYARSDKKDAPRISIGGRLVADLLRTAGADRVLTMALHAPQVHGFFSMPVDHLNAIAELAHHFVDHDLTNTVVVSPDLGNAKPASAFARVLGVPVAAGNKVRLADDQVRIESIVGDVEGKDVIVLDDEIANGGSIVALLDVLRERGVRRIALAFTHALLTGKAVQRLAEQADVVEVVVTNTVPISPDKQFDGLKIRSVAPLFAEAIRRIHCGESVSSLFVEVPQHAC